ncbi:MAG: protein-glutamate O-methyltransferase [Inquilinus sp.]|nr:protein-glutamate O-methyltransferase [Inquilinus sp.]
MQADNFEVLQKLLKQRSGLVVSPEKAYLLESRLMPVARKWSVKGLDELVALVRAKRDEKLLQDITEAMTTNESSFFRDTRPFDQFKSVVLPQLMEQRASRRHLRIWCAAASTGQEPYSLAMVLHEERVRMNGWRVEILGTDLSTEVLDKARDGVYSQFEIQRGLPITYLVKYFRQDGDKWLLSPEIRQMVDYRPFNLLEDPTALGRFDIVFLRNVLIYFDRPDKASILGRVAKLMPSDGVLYLGGAETVFGISDRFKPVEGQRGIYQPTSDAEPSSAGRQAAAF